MLIRRWPGWAGCVRNCRAIIAGEGDLAGVRAAAAAPAWLGRVELPGWVAGEAKARCWPAPGCSCCRRAEGVPMALLEAQAAGLPVVATRVGGIPQVVVEGYSGMLAEPDDVASLVAALEAGAGGRRGGSSDGRNRASAGAQELRRRARARAAGSRVVPARCGFVPEGLSAACFPATPQSIGDCRPPCRRGCCR